MFLLLSGSPLPAPAPHTEVIESLTERREPETHASTPVRARCVACPHPLAVPGTHGMALRPSSVPQRVILPEPPTSSLPHFLDPESDLAHDANPIVTRQLATLVTDPDLEFTAAFALVAELVDFTARYCREYIASLVKDSESVYPPSAASELALGSDVLEDRQFELECLAAAFPRFASMLLCPKGDPDALDIPTPRSYAEAIAGEYSSQWQTAMDVEMASWKSTDTYVNEVPPLGANIVDGMWIFIVKRPPGSPPAFMARYDARGFNQQQGVDIFQTFSPTPKMTTLRVLQHVAAHRDYELHSLTSPLLLCRAAFTRRSGCAPTRLHWVVPAGTRWSLWRPVYDLRQAPQEWHDTLRTTLAALGFAPSSADPSLFLRTDTTLPPFYVLVYVLQRFGFQFSSPQPTPLSTGHSLSAPPLDESVEPSGPYPKVVGCLITSAMGLMLGGHGLVVLTGDSDASWADDQVTQRSSQGYTFSLGSISVLWRSTCSSSVLSSSSEAEIYAGAMAAQELRWLTYLLTGYRLHEVFIASWEKRRRVTTSGDRARRGLTDGPRRPTTAPCARPQPPSPSLPPSPWRPPLAPPPPLPTPLPLFTLILNFTPQLTLHHTHRDSATRTNRRTEATDDCTHPPHNPPPHPLAHLLRSLCHHCCPNHQLLHVCHVSSQRSQAANQAQRETAGFKVVPVVRAATAAVVAAAAVGGSGNEAERESRGEMRVMTW
ncbi:unnamed protein product, partial [Closterium sp. NIES-53]